MKATRRPRRASEPVGRRLRALRVWRFMSQQEVADRMVRLGFVTWYRQTVSEVEKARRGVNIDELDALAHVYQVTLCDLVRPSTESPDGWLSESVPSAKELSR